MIFENGRVIIKGGDIPVIEPGGDTIDNDTLQDLFKRHGFDQSTEKE